SGKAGSGSGQTDKHRDGMTITVPAGSESEERVRCSRWLQDAYTVPQCVPQTQSSPPVQTPSMHPIKIHVRQQAARTLPPLYTTSSTKNLQESPNAQTTQHGYRQ